MKIDWDRSLTAVLVVCALTTTALVVYRTFFSTAGLAQVPDQKPVFIESWQDHARWGVQLGSSDAPVQLIEFADFECPFCATFHKNLKTLRERYPNEIALSYVHYPLGMHCFALPAARAAECARAQGRFEAMHDLLFEQQTEFGLKPWGEFARNAGVPDLVAFESCTQGKERVPGVAEGQKLGDQLGVPGTPTLIINGWKLGRPPGVEELDLMIRATLDGKSPMSAATAAR